MQDGYYNRPPKEPGFWSKFFYTAWKQSLPYIRRFKWAFILPVAFYLFIWVVDALVDGTVSNTWRETEKTGSFTRVIKRHNNGDSIVQVGKEVLKIDGYIKEELLGTNITFFEETFVYESGNSKVVRHLCFVDSAEGCLKIYD